MINYSKKHIDVNECFTLKVLDLYRSNLMFARAKDNLKKKKKKE